MGSTGIISGIILLAVAMVFPIPARAAGDCPSRFQRIFGTKKEALTETITLVWYPKADFVIISHVDLEVNDQLWNPTRGYFRSGSMKSAEVATGIAGKGMFRFKLAVTRAELDRLENFILGQTGKDARHLCVGGACKAVRNTTGIVIPFPFSKIPVLAAGYLTVTKHLGYSRVLQIDYVGADALKNLASPAVPVELAAGALLVAGIGAGGKLVYSLIPIEAKPEAGGAGGH